MAEKQKLNVKIAEGMAKVGAGLVSGTKTTWKALAKKALQFVGGLFMERKEDGEWVISIGRVSWWLAFSPALYIWISGGGMLEEGNPMQDITPNHLTILMTLAGYNFGKKVADTVGKVWGNNGPG